MARLFFALWPDGNAAQALASLGAGIAQAAGGRAVPEAKLHLTLVFLGEVEASRHAAVHRAAGHAEGHPFRMALDEVGRFARAGAAWAGCRKPARELLALQSSLVRVLAAEGFPSESRGYTPHLTLARRIAAPMVVAPVNSVSWQVTTFALVETAADGSYATLAQWPLAGLEEKTRPVSR